MDHSVYLMIGRDLIGWCNRLEWWNDCLLMTIISYLCPFSNLWLPTTPLLKTWSNVSENRKWKINLAVTQQFEGKASIPSVECRKADPTVFKWRDPTRTIACPFYCNQQFLMPQFNLYSTTYTAFLWGLCAPLIAFLCPTDLFNSQMQEGMFWHWAFHHNIISITKGISRPIPGVNWKP